MPPYDPELAGDVWPLSAEPPGTSSPSGPRAEDTRKVGYDMHHLGTGNLSAKWDELKWGSGRLVSVSRKVEPLEVPGIHPIPGLYRITWVGIEDWPLFPKMIRVEASPDIFDPVLKLEGVMPPALLTLGRAKDVYARIRQHFGTNENNNRLLKAMRKLFPDRHDDELRNLAQRNLLIEWAYVGDWLDRCRFEHYGCAMGVPLCDGYAEY